MISEALDATLTIFSDDAQHSFVRSSFSYLIELELGMDEDSTVQFLLGRNLISAFKMTIVGIDHVTIDDHV